MCGERDAAASDANEFIGCDLPGRHIVFKHAAHLIGVTGIGMVEQDDGNVGRSCRGHVFGGVGYGAEQNSGHVHVDECFHQFVLPLRVG